MPAWEPGKGMSDYVKGRNSGLQVEDFKLQAPNIAATRHKSQHQLQRGDRQNGLRLSAKHQQLFYETDPSDIDESSVGSISGRQGEGLVVRPSSEGSEDNETEDDEAPRDAPLKPAGATSSINGDLTAKQLQMLAQHEGRNGMTPDGFALGVMKGDSYPTSTSGPTLLSTGTKSTHAQAASHAPNTSAVTQGQTGSRQSAMRMPLGAPPGHHFGPARQPQPRAQVPAVVRQNVRNQDATPPARVAGQHSLSETDARYERRDDQMQPIVRRPGLVDRSGRPLSAQIPPLVSSNDAQRCSSTEANHLRSNSPQTNHMSPKIQATAALDQGHPYHLSNAENHTLAPVQRHSSDAGTGYRDSSDFNNQNPADDDDQQVGHDNELDYGIEQLRKMDYHVLKSQSFDTDPNTTDPTIPSSKPKETLGDRLATVAGLNAKSQKDFFASLALDDWEEAGDWFLDQFGGIVSSFKAARQEKRKAARQFEDEIERRHDAVSRKRKRTEDALGAMKQSGSQVLLATPQKARTTN